MTPELREMAEAAAAYCQHIEAESKEWPQWLCQVGLLLARLHGAVAALGQPAVDFHPPIKPDLELRFELFSQLRAQLGRHDCYRTELDWNGSLADDLTDIYCELKYGLTQLEGAPELALELWRHGFRVHWGMHLMDASRHLYQLAFTLPLSAPDGEKALA